MKTGRPHVTVVIPTRERADVFEKSFLTCLDQDYENLTILVSDNLSGDRTKDIALGASDPRVKYVNTGKRLAMTGNYEFALSHVDSDWVTIIGDDDGLLPGAVSRVAEYIKDAPNIQAIRSDVCLYRWPSLTGKEFGTLQIPMKRGSEVRNTKRWLNRVMSGLDLYPNLPMLYSGGFAKVSMLLAAKAKRGQYYHSCIPDVYSSMAIASVIDEYIFSFEPFAIDGVSGHSTGTALVNRTKDDASARMFLSESNLPQHADIPTGANGEVPKVHQAWIYESYLQSRFLRDGAHERTHYDQLVVTLTPGHGGAADEWAAAFAARHDLDLARARGEADAARQQHKRYWRSKRLARALNTHYAGGDSDRPLRDVHEASLHADAILKRRPGRIEGILNLGAKAWSKMAPA